MTIYYYIGNSRPLYCDKIKKELHQFMKFTSAWLYTGL